MLGSESRLKVIVCEEFNAQLAELFPKNLLTFHNDPLTLREQLYKNDSALLLLPANLEEAAHLVECLRKDRYLEVLPIALYSETELEFPKRVGALEQGVNEFIYLKDPGVDLSKKKLLALAELYWKLKKEDTQNRFEDLSRSVEFLDSLIEHLPNMVFVKDAKELRFVRFNRAGEKLLGYHREDLIGKNDYDFFPKDQADHFTEKDRAVIASGQMLEILEEPIYTKDGTRILHTRKIPLYDEKGNPTYLLGISEDITEIKKAEHERLQLVKEQSARMEAEKGIEIRDEFLALASHELKTPLTSLALQLQIIQRWIAKKDFSESMIEKLLKVFGDSFYQLHRLGTLVDDLLDVSRIQSGKLSIHLEKHDIASIVKELVTRSHEQLKVCGNEIIWGAMEECICECDASRIEQCVANLLSNAMKYGSRKPIEISLQAIGGRAVLKVKDSGIGVDPSFHDLIFRRFERAVSSRYISGLGLGLYITREIIHAHHGTVTIASELGHGSTFTLEIPLA